MNIEEIKSLDDEEFERAVKELDVKGILWVMGALQTTMCDEQRRFETLSHQLQEIQDRSSYRYRKLSASLCSTQRLLTSLCTKHIICCGQRSEKAMSRGELKSDLKKTSLLSNFNPFSKEEEYDSQDFVVHKTNFEEEEEEEFFQDELEVIPEEDEDTILDSCLIDKENSDTEDEKISFNRKHMRKFWNPRKLLEDLYSLNYFSEPSKIHSITKEGYLDVLPLGRKKVTYWNPWKKKYIQLKKGFLLILDNKHAEKPTFKMQLMGSHIEILEKKIIGVDDQKGHYVVFRCQDEESLMCWSNALLSHCEVSSHIIPCQRPLSIYKKILILDVGSCSTRAGILMSSPSLPQLFFPTVCAFSKKSNQNIFGFEALNPDSRKEMHFPFHSSATISKHSIDTSLLPDLFRHIFRELNVSPEDYKVQLSMPRKLSLQTKLKVAQIMLQDFKIKGLNLTHQAILSLHAYNSKSGIVIDIGDRLDVLPIVEGYIVESGVTRLPYGGQRLLHHLKHALAGKNISVFSEVGTYLARYVLEQLCYIAEDYSEEIKKYNGYRDHVEKSISISQFFDESFPCKEINLDLGRFHVPEGLFTPENWGLDIPGLHKLVHHAIQECGVDLRKEMTKSLYVSGGLTLLPGFVRRLELEIEKLSPNGIIPKVHGSAYRYHMSYIGACQIASEEKFDEICISQKMWEDEGNTCVKKWHT